MSHQQRLQKDSQTFLGSLAHELRTPLTGILAHLEVLKKQEVETPVREASLNVLYREANRLARLVQDMLLLGRLEVGEGLMKRPIDLLLVTEAAIAEVIPIAESKEMTISLEAISALPYVLGDADKLKQVFLNILDNGIKYGRTGDKIDVCLAPQLNRVQVTIRDTGPGISLEHLPYVTERFYRANTSVTGSGLGLAIVAEILRYHDSQLEIASQTESPQTHTTISFLLPAHSPQT